jgi:AcrR family transcriptional regulator
VATAKEKGTPRNVEATKARFLAAVDSLLRKDGLQSLGVNAIAERAGRDKALLYKYFGDLDGLYAAFAETAGLFPTLEEMLGPAAAQHPTASSPDTLALSKAFVSGYLREIRKRPLTLEILRWELVVRNPLTKALSDFRSKQTLAFNALLKAPPGLDLAALTSILYGGMVYLLLKAEAPGKFNGLDLRDDTAWARIEAGLHAVLDGLFKSARKP